MLIGGKLYKTTILLIVSVNASNNFNTTSFVKWEDWFQIIIFAQVSMLILNQWFVICKIYNTLQYNSSRHPHLTGDWRQLTVKWNSVNNRLVEYELHMTICFSSPLGYLSCCPILWVLLTSLEQMLTHYWPSVFFGELNFQVYKSSSAIIVHMQSRI